KSGAFTSIMHYALLLLVLTVLYAYSYDIGYEITAWTCLIVFYSVSLKCLLTPIYVHGQIKTYFTIELLFLLNAFVIFFWPYQLDLLGVIDIRKSIYFGNTYYDESAPAIALSAIGVVAFVAGI